MMLSGIKQLFSVHTSVATKGVSALHLFVSSFLLTMALAVFTVAIHMQPTAIAAPVQSAAVVETKATTPMPTTTPSSPAPTTTAQTSAAVENCTPAGKSSLPSALNLSTMSDGLTNIIDTPSTYKIFGNTATQIRNQLRSCAPSNGSGEVFAGETGYTLTWQYAATTTDGGLCTLSRLKIGLHVTMSLPAWSPSAQATSGLANQWKNFISNLNIHENGHVALDTQYANQLLSDLQSMPAADCATLNAAVQTKATTTLANLDTANATYDNQTNHGATQGAILP